MNIKQTRAGAIPIARKLEASHGLPLACPAVALVERGSGGGVGFMGVLQGADLLSGKPE